MANSVNVTLNAIDKISPVIGQLQGRASALSSVMNGIFQGAGFAAFNAGIGLATSGVSKLTNSLTDAASKQVQALATASDIGTNLGINMTAAQGVVERTQTKIAQVAAQLPGVTSEYQEIFNSLSGTVATQFKGNEKAFEAVSLDITKRVGVLAAIRKADAGQAGSAINRFAAGTMGFGEASVNDIFQKNPQLMQAIRDESAKAGVELDKWKDQTTATRLNILQAALKTATPDTLIKSFDGTLDSMIQTTQTNLFDPLVGLFGVMRKVKVANNRSVLDAATQAYQSMMNFFEALGKIGSSLGLSFDPMAGVIKVLDFFTNLNNTIVSRMSELSPKGFNPGQLLESLGARAGEFIRSIGTKVLAAIPKVIESVNGMIQNLVTFVSNIDTTALASAIGQGLSWFMNNAARVLMAIDWGAVGQLITTSVFKLVMLLGQTLRSIDYGAIGTLLFSGLVSVVRLFIGAQVGAIRALLGSIFDGISQVINWISKVLNSILDMLKKAYDTITSFNPVSAIQGGASAVAGAVGGTWNNVTGAVGGVLSSGADAVGSGLGSLADNISRPFKQEARPTQVSPTINLQSNSSNNSELANMVVDRISALYRQGINDNLATVG